MAQIVGSAVAEEIVKQAFAGLSGRHQHEKGRHMERLEMAQIKLEAALETSHRWQIKDSSLLRWRKKLKRVAQECDNVLRQCKQRVVEDEAREQEVRSSSFPRRVLARATGATRSFVTAVLGHSGDSHGSAAVRRFEWFADGAGEFLRFIEIGGTPRRHMFVDPLIGHLLAGQMLRYRAIRGSQCLMFSVHPVCLEGRGTEAKLLLALEDNEAPEENMCLGIILRISESTDIVGTIIKYLEQLVTPLFKPTAEFARKELTQLPTQDFRRVPSICSIHAEHWENIHTILTQWFRPNPLCCKQHKPGMNNSYSSTSTTAMKLSDVSDIEPIIAVLLERRIPLTEYNLHRSKDFEGEGRCLKNLTHLKVGLLLVPHGCTEDLIPADESSTIEVINGTEQSGMLSNISLEQLNELILPKAIDCFHQRSDVMVYQAFWKSRHGTAFLQVGKTGLVKKPRPSRVIGDRRPAIQRRGDPKLEKWIQVLVKEFLNMWVAQAPSKLQSSIVEWIEKANKMELPRSAN